jgi:hypothetical protein
MLTAKTVLKKGNDFIPIEEWTGKIEDPDYIEGALIITLDGRAILNESLWDDVNWIWPYIANGLIDIADGKDFQTNFPDQPVTFSIKHMANDWLLLHVFSEDREFAMAKIRKDEYLCGMTHGARDYLTKMEAISPGNEPALDHYLDLLNSVEKRLPKYKS